MRSSKSFVPFLIVLCASVHFNAQTFTDNIHIDQFGYLPQSQKIAILSDPQEGFNASQNYTPGATIEIVDNITSEVVFSAQSVSWNNGETHLQSGDKAWWVDFSALTTEGNYYVYDPENDLRSFDFSIGADVYKDALTHSLRAFFYQRCGVAKTEMYGGNWHDQICHHNSEQDLTCLLVTDPTNQDLALDLSGGWHDAGDYNKYVNFAHDPLHQLLAAFEDRPEIWGDDLNIPESGNGVPDILDEIKIELDWLLKMQQTDGSVLMKVSVTGFEASSPPSADMAARRYGPAQASSTRAASSVFAHAAVVYASQGMNIYADTLLSRAILAWDWVQDNPDYSYYDNAGFSSANPEVAPSTQDNFLTGAAAYLFAATNEGQYRNYFDAHYETINPYNWGYWYLFESDIQDAMLYYAGLENATTSVADNIQNSFVNSMHANNADMLTAFLNEADAYRAQIGNNDYTWGNNREKSNAAILYLNLIKYGLNNGEAADSIDYRNAADGYVHFMHGSNALNLVMLSNMYAFNGDNCANEIYHGWFEDGSDYDNALNSTYGPPPGIVPGGINPNYSPDASYMGPPIEPPMNQPIQKSYGDWNTSWPENSWEITENSITYQAAYVRMISNYVSASEVVTPVSQLKLPDTRIYPNPGQDYIVIALNQTLQGRFQIANLMGQQIDTYSAQPAGGLSYRIDISNLTPGVYLLRANGAWNKFIKE